MIFIITQFKVFLLHICSILCKKYITMVSAIVKIGIKLKYHEHCQTYFVSPFITLLLFSGTNQLLELLQMVVACIFISPNVVKCDAAHLILG